MKTVRLVDYVPPRIKYPPDLAILIHVKSRNNEAYNGEVSPFSNIL